jgi:hypothetical protein
MNLVAEGYNSFDTKKTPSGVVKYLPDPKSVIALIKSGKLRNTSCWFRVEQQRSLLRH